MTLQEKKEIRRLAGEIYNNGGYAVQNSDAGHEKAVEKYQRLSQEAYNALLEYLDGL
jgi:hypothetical protein